MDGRETEFEGIEERVAELEKLAEDLEGAPEAEVLDILDRATALLTEVNARIEDELLAAEDEARELEELVEKVDFGPFDAALERVERPQDGPGGG